MTRFTRPLGLGLILALGTLAWSQLKPLDHSVYDSWKSIQGRSISGDGSWGAWSITPQEGDALTEVKSLSGGKTFSIERGSGLRFTEDSAFLLATQVPKFAEARDARRARKPANEQPKNALVILNLKSGEQTVIEKVSSWSLAQKGSGWIMYRLDTGTPAAGGTGGPGGGRPGGRPGGAPPAGGPGNDDFGLDFLDQNAPAQTAPAQEPAKTEEGKKKSDHAVGSQYILRELATGKEVKIEDVASFTWNEDGKKALVVLSTKDGKGDGLFLYEFGSGEPQKTPILTGMGRYPRVVFNETASQVAFYTDRDSYSEKTPEPTLYLWDGKEAKALVKPGDTRVDKDSRIVTGTLSFSKSGNFLNIAVQPKPVPEPPAVHEEDKVNVDVWHWQDPQLQLVQLRTAAADRNRSFSARLNLKSNSLVVLEDKNLRNVQVPGEGDPAVGLALDTLPYQKSGSWTETKIDVYLVDLATGTKRLIEEGLLGLAFLSPDGTWLIVVDEKTKVITAVRTSTGEEKVISKGLPELFNVESDVPALPAPYGFGGFTKDDHLVIYDRWDGWLVDLKGQKDPVCFTRGMGRGTETEYRILNINSDSPWLDTKGTVYFTRAEQRTKEENYALGDFTGRTSPKTLIDGPMVVTGLQKAQNADKILYTKQTFSVFPDVWVSDLSFKQETKLSDANPQQKEYLWGTSELVNFYSNDGAKLDGILIKPGGFDPSKQYPMVVYFYERESDRLHRYTPPAPSASTINPTFFASNGYVVFIPDIPYKEGYPGESAVNAILPGTHKVLGMGFVDPKRVGLQGQSWGGYQTAYLITETNMFAAAGAGAAVSNMTSAYGGIRYGSGLVRQFQYEVGQSRIGKSLWEAPLRYLENSPLFYADKIRTPLLMMNNDQDGAVPWTEGIQLFAALRRLEQPVWMLVYNGEDHNIIQRKNRKDFTIRQSQFFDHYLKGAPMPVWMSSGIPAVDKGRTMGLEIPAKP